jgi:hypothetical protein
MNRIGSTKTSPLQPERLLRDYFHAKDENRPELLAAVFAPEASLEIRNRSDRISFPAVTVGGDAIAEVLVRRFNRTFENIRSYYLSRPNAADPCFSCDWLVTMTERQSRSVRVGCGSYEWTFRRAPALRVMRLVIAIEAMLELAPALAGEVTRWRAALDYPWTSAADVTRSLPTAELEPIRHYLRRPPGSG